MATSYRNPRFTAAFPFGHGLSYSNFLYGLAKADLCPKTVTITQPLICVSLSVRNIGKVTAATVAQLYLEFPAIASYPTPVLKGFQKINELAPGSSAKATFKLLRRDLSYYDAA